MALSFMSAFAPRVSPVDNSGIVSAATQMGARSAPANNSGADLTSAYQNYFTTATGVFMQMAQMHNQLALEQMKGEQQLQNTKLNKEMQENITALTQEWETRRSIMEKSIDYQKTMDQTNLQGQWRYNTQMGTAEVRAQSMRDSTNATQFGDTFRTGLTQGMGPASAGSLAALGTPGMGLDPIAQYRLGLSTVGDNALPIASSVYGKNIASTISTMATAQHTNMDTQLMPYRTILAAQASYNNNLKTAASMVGIKEAFSPSLEMYKNMAASNAYFDQGMAASLYGHFMKQDPQMAQSILSMQNAQQQPGTPMGLRVFPMAVNGFANGLYRMFSPGASNTSGDNVFQIYDRVGDPRYDTRASYVHNLAGQLYSNYDPSQLGQIPGWQGHVGSQQQFQNFAVQSVNSNGLGAYIAPGARNDDFSSGLNVMGQNGVQLAKQGSGVLTQQEKDFQNNFGDNMLVSAAAAVVAPGARNFVESQGENVANTLSIIPHPAAQGLSRLFKALGPGSPAAESTKAAGTAVDAQSAEAAAQNPNVPGATQVNAQIQTAQNPAVSQHYTNNPMQNAIRNNYSNRLGDPNYMGANSQYPGSIRQAGPGAPPPVPSYQFGNGQAPPPSVVSPGQIPPSPGRLPIGAVNQLPGNEPPLALPLAGQPGPQPGGMQGVIPRTVSNMPQAPVVGPGMGRPPINAQGMTMPGQGAIPQPPIPTMPSANMNTTRPPAVPLPPINTGQPMSVPPTTWDINPALKQQMQSAPQVNVPPPPSVVSPTKAVSPAVEGTLDAIGTNQGKINAKLQKLMPDLFKNKSNKDVQGIMQQINQMSSAQQEAFANQLEGSMTDVS